MCTNYACDADNRDGGSKNERQQHTVATTAAGQWAAATAANTNKGTQTQTGKHDQANAHKRVQANATGHKHTNEGRQTRMRAGKHE